MSNIDIISEIKPSSFRKLAIGSWKKPTDPLVYTKLKCDVTHLKSFFDKSNTSVSWVHFFTKAMGLIYAAYPELNNVLLGNKLYQRKDITAFIHTHLRLKKQYDLTGVTIKDTHIKSIQEIAQEINDEVSNVRNNQNKQHNQTKKIINLFPSWSYGCVIRIFDFLMNRLNLNLSWLNLPKDPFGSYGVTAIGSLGFEEAFVPLFPLARLTMIVAVGKPYKEWIFENNMPQERLMLNLCFSMDHRNLDGAHVAKPLRLLKKIIKNPENYSISFE
jgi:pyruvate/2-oxoglutarate dehydrogenase complex dihydrolipoamide acyltransferase (E2) component